MEILLGWALLWMFLTPNFRLMNPSVALCSCRQETTRSAPTTSDKICLCGWVLLLVCRLMISAVAAVLAGVVGTVLSQIAG